MKILIFSFFQILINFFLFNKIKFFSNTLKIIDKPNKIKLHKKETPILGGLFLMINLICYFFFIVFFDKTNSLINETFHLYDTKQVIIFIFSIIVFFLIGLYDDKYNLSYNKKLILTLPIIVILVVIDEGLKVQIINLSFFNIEVSLNRFHIFFSILCVLTYINIINMFDGVNLQSALNFIFILILTSLLKIINIDFLIFFIIFFLFFIFFNKDEKIFLGDSGTLVLGFLLAYILIKEHNINKLNSDIIFFFTLIPFLDMLRLIISRTWEGKNPFGGDNNHLHHKLQKKYGNFKSNLVIVTLVFLPFYFSFLFNFQYNILFIFLSTFFYFYLIFIDKKN